MAVNQIQQAVGAYEKILREATEEYERKLRKAELDLKAAMGTDKTEPSGQQSTVTMSKTDYENLQVQLEKVSEFIERHPEMR